MNFADFAKPNNDYWTIIVKFYSFPDISYSYLLFLALIVAQIIICINIQQFSPLMNHFIHIYIDFDYQFILACSDEKNIGRDFLQFVRVIIL